MNLEENHPVQVNQKAYYDELQILKIWDTFLRRKKNLHYWISESDSKSDSLFKEVTGPWDMEISKKAGILLTQNDELYCNSEGRSISICGAVDNFCVEDFNFNGITFLVL